MNRMRIPPWILFLITMTLPAQETAHPKLVSLSLDQFRFFQSAFGATDRLFVRDKQVFFLADQSMETRLFHGGLSLSYHGSPPLSISKKRQTDTGDINGRFHDSMESELFLSQLASRYPSLATFFSLGSSVEGRPINALRISAAPDDAVLPRIYIIGCHHAREWISVEVPLDFARYLLESATSNEAVRQCLENCQIYILPILNPDGLEYSIYRYRYWRKNRRYSGSSHWGIDLNRNYGYSWGADDRGSSPEPGSDTYRGPGEFSEPETAVIRDFMNRFPPAGVISYHNFSQMILYPWGYTRTPPPDSELMNRLASRMSEEMEKVNGRRYSFGSGADLLYLTNGGLDDWAYGVHGAISFTIELPPPSSLSHFFTDEGEIEPICLENRPALLTFISHFTDQVRTTGRFPIIRGAGYRRSDLR